MEKSLETLSRHELEVLRQVAEGLTDRQISERLGLPLGTARRQVSDLFEKLGTSQRVEAAILALHARVST